MKEYWHSVILERDFCNGCTYCLDRCPTQAIRVIGGKAQIINERCIDCGECLKVCPFHAKGAQTDSLDMLSKFEYNIALPAISLYGQFDLDYDINRIFNGLYQLGFDHVFDVAYAADILTVYQQKILNRTERPKPLISTFCPAVTRLIQIRYPALIDHIIQLESPMQVAAWMARERAAEITGLSQDKIGVFYITQCPAKITSIKKPLGIEDSQISGAISIEGLYTQLIKSYDDVEIKRQIQKASGKGVGWGMVGGQSFAMGIENYMAVDGIEEVIKVLDRLEMGKLKDVDFLEAYACVTGCVGGPLNVENPFIAKSRIRMRSKRIRRRYEPEDLSMYDQKLMQWDQDITPYPVLKLDTDIKRALEKMGKIEELFQSLPGIDCGACGAPTCRALAEDIVMGRAELNHCLVQMNTDRRKNDESE